MADTSMFLQLSSHWLRRSDSSRASMGSTRGAVRCRRIMPMGLLYLSQQEAMRLNCVSSPVIMVLASFASVFAWNAIVTFRTESLSVISTSKNVLSPGAVLMYSSIACSPVRHVPDGMTIEYWYLMPTPCSLAAETKKFRSDVSSVKNRGLSATIVLVSNPSKLCSTHHLSLRILAVFLYRRSSLQDLYAVFMLSSILHLCKKNAAVAPAAVTKESR